MKSKLIWAAVILVGGAGIAAVAIWWKNRGGDEEAEAAAIRTAEVTRGPMIVRVSASGEVRAHQQVEVKSRASGVIAEIQVEPGDRVEAGALLVKLDPTDEERGVREAESQAASARARLAQAQAGVAAARADAAEARTRAESREAALQRGLVSAEEARTAQTAAQTSGSTVAVRQAEVRAAQAELERAQLAIAEARRRVEETTIVAPIGGTVLNVPVERGSTVSSGTTTVGGGTTLLTLADLSRLLVLAKVDEAQIGSVRPDQPVEIRVDAHPDRTFRGRVVRIHPLGVTTSNVVTFDVEVEVVDEQSSLLMPGMTADVEIETAREENALLMPLTALRSERRQRFVLLAAGDRRPVRTGPTDGEQIVIVEGLAEGDRVLVAGRAEMGASRGKNEPGGLGGILRGGRPRGGGGGGRGGHGGGR